MNFLEKTYRKNDQIVSRKVADEYILVPIRQKAGDLKNVYTLNEVAARVWELIDGDRKTKEIKDIIVQEFEVLSEEAEVDLKEYLLQLKDINAIV